MRGAACSVGSADRPAVGCCALRVLCFAFCLLVISVLAAQARPLVLIFPASAEKETAPNLAKDATAAIKTYFRETDKVDVILFDPEVPTIKRAVMENAIRTEDLKSAVSPDQRLKIALAIGADYAASGTVLFEKDQITMSVWLGQVKPKRIWEKRSSASAASPALQPTPMNVANALQSAASSAVSQIVSEVFGGISVAKPRTTQPHRNPLEEGSPALDAGKRVEQGDNFLKQGDTARAIMEYRRAVNMEPRNVGTRIKLAKAYVARGLMDYAIAELNRAQQIEPDNPEIPQLLVAIYEAKGKPEKAAGVYIEKARQQPSNARSRIDAAEVYARQGKTEDAIAQLRAAIEIEPKNVEARERLALLLASQGSYDESLKQLEELEKLVEGEPESAAAARYGRFRAIFDREMKRLLEQIDTTAKEFADGDMTHERYYDSAKWITVSTGALSRYLEGLTPPASLSKSHKRLLLGCSLISQYGTTLMSYLETKNDAKRKEAAALLEAGKTELKAAAP